ncbi:serine/threonine protein kinase [Pontiella agarivorans]|uniref:Serine/threonine-protein kinase n=1 Tax=Pontiella agarivorans TaxID=3038953 RepID=A0ABU5MY05_9BACT|nr:serine/threonine-protein kinase [Pontiella agarivorans]MDZ8119055.1 serine/threonine-protein kinase [Pontiella agarivorans]
MDSDYKDLGEEFATRWRALGDFFDPANCTFDPGEQRDLNPILEGLKRESKHYTEPVFVCEGGEKQIFKVRDLRTDRLVAMAKPLKRASDSDKEQFLREARLTACLQHPNIMSIYDQGIDEEGVPYFTMEFVPGDNLKEIVEKLVGRDPEYVKRYPRERLLEIFIKICDAVSYAHSRGVVHLDVKPANIKVGPFGEAVLCDWGLSKILSNGFDEEGIDGGRADDLPNSDLLNDLTPSGTVKGTPGFIAPEQVDGSAVISEQTDVYALGAVLYFILAYSPPISGGSFHDILRKTVKGELTPLSKSASGRFIPKGLDAVAMKALELKLADRYGSVRELREELDRFLLGFATEAQHAGWLDRTVLLFKRRPVVFRVIGISCVLLVLVLIFSFARVVHVKQLAVAAREQAEENLRLYKDESSRSKMLADSISAVAVDLHNRDNYLEASGKARLLAVQLDQETDPDKRAFLAHDLAMLNFVRQNFRKATNFFELSEVLPEHDIFYELSLKYAPFKSRDRDWLDPVELRDIILAIPARNDNVAYSMAFYYLRTKSKNLIKEKEVLPLIETLLDRLNHQGWYAEQTDTLSLEPTDKGWALSLARSPYVVFNLPLPVAKTETNVLNPLGLYSLDMSYSALSDPSHLNGTGIKVLDIRGITTWTRPQIRLLFGLQLETLIHSLDESDEFLAEILPDVELIRVNAAL